MSKSCPEDSEMLGCDIPWPWELMGGASGSICCSVNWVITAGRLGKKAEEWDCEEGIDGSIRI